VGAAGGANDYLEKNRVFKAGASLNTVAWNNRMGRWFCFVGFEDQGQDE
jgi:hypothetical protein